ncbi:hypothetical protein [Pedobacter yonginense]|nr:hypothetical protein [Pedobacter yonginense]
MVTSSPSDNSFSGSPRVYDLNGNKSDINYQSYEICNTVSSSNNSITRSGPLCFVMSSTQYNSYPGGVAPSYPGNNGTLETYTITMCPLDDYVWLMLALFSGLVFYLFRSKVEMNAVLQR